MSKKETYERFCEVMASAGIYQWTKLDGIRVIDRLIYCARSLEHINEDDCNSDSTPRRAAREDRRQREIVSLLAPYRLKAKFNGDPRGYAARVIFPDPSDPTGKRSLYYNTMGGPEEGYGIPT